MISPKYRTALNAGGLIAALLTTSAALAQPAPDQPFALGTIVVVGTGLPTEIMQSPASVSAIDARDIRRVPPSSVARILGETAGVRVYESGIDRIKIRGERSNRVAIMIDGQKLADHTTYGTPILIDPGSIERIEIVRGPSSVVSGNRAIGGVVNIITKRGADRPFEASVSAGYFSATEGYRGTASLAGSQGNFDYRLSFSRSDRGDRKTPDGTLTPSGVEDRSLSLHAGYEAGPHYFAFKAQDYDLAAEVYTGDEDFRIDLPKRDLRKYALFYEGEALTPWLENLTLDAYTQRVDRAFENDVTFPAGPMTMNVLSLSEDEQTTSGLHAKARLNLAPGQRTIVGLEYEDDRLESDKTSVRTTTGPFGPPTATTTRRVSDASIRTSSLYAQHEVALGPRLTATLGARYYHVKADLDAFVSDGVAAPKAGNSDDRVLGSFGLVYDTGNDVTFRANVAQGYTYPTLAELFLTTTAGGGTTLGNSELAPETSTTFELGARVNRGAAMLDATLFHTSAEDYIASVGTGAPRTAQYRNVDSVDSWGAELDAEFAPENAWDLRPYVSASYLRREFNYANGYVTSDSGTPRLSGSVGVRRDWRTGRLSGTWDLFVRGESETRQRDESGDVVDETGGFATLNLRGSVALNENVSLDFEAANLLDKSYRPADQLEGAERNVSVFLTAVF